MMSVKRRKLDHDVSGNIASPSTFGTLGDELLILILSYLPVGSLIDCQRLSHRFYALASDARLWRGSVNHRFLHPQHASSEYLGLDRAPGASLLDLARRLRRGLSNQLDALQSSSLDWKLQYRLMHNWSKGSCKSSEVAFLRQPHSTILVSMNRNSRSRIRNTADIFKAVFTLDASDGLRAWTLSSGNLIASDTAVCRLDGAEVGSSKPAALAVDPNAFGNTSTVAIGFQTGRLAVCLLDRADSRLELTVSHKTNAPITALAVASDLYVAALDEAHALTVYAIPDPRKVPPARRGKDRTLRVLAAIKSTTEPTEPALSIRVLSTCIAVSCVYALPAYPRGWSINLQELRLSSDGTVTHSRFATLDQPAPAAKSQARWTAEHAVGTGKSTSRSSGTSVTLGEMSRPRSFCYAHPFLLVSHPDNTLRLLLIHSTVGELRMLHLRRLWGHTSSVESARISSQGKAVTVARGGEVRAWDGAKRGSIGVPIRSTAQSTGGASTTSRMWALAHREAHTSDINISSHQQLLGFDEEEIVLLVKRSPDVLSLVTHNFS